MGENNKTDELKHWGIKGMRWGIRRTPKELGKINDKKKAELEEEKFKTSKKKTVSKMTDEEISKEISRRKLELDLKKQKDAELQQEVNRLNLEKQYAALNPPKLSLGKQIYDKVWPTVEKSLLEAGGQLIKDGLVDKGKALLGLKETKIDYDKELKRMNYEDKLKTRKVDQELARINKETLVETKKAALKKLKEENNK